jgi:hypothetical protein
VLRSRPRRARAWVRQSIAATEEEIREREVVGLQRELEGIAFRLEHVAEHPRLAWSLRRRGRRSDDDFD